MLFSSESALRARGNTWWYPYSTPITLPSGSGHQSPFDQFARRPTCSLPAQQPHFILDGGCKSHEHYR